MWSKSLPDDLIQVLTLCIGDIFQGRQGCFKSVLSSLAPKPAGGLLSSCLQGQPRASPKQQALKGLTRL